MTGLPVAMIASLGCAARYETVAVPPRIDLTEHDVIAVVEFDASNEGELGPLATQRFKDLARRDQGLVRMLTVHLDTERRDGRVLRRVGENHGARTVLIGTLDVSEIRPNLSIADTLRMPSGPKRAPDRYTTAPSVGTPTTATSTPSRSRTCGSRMNVRGPEKRGISNASGGP